MFLEEGLISQPSGIGKVWSGLPKRIPYGEKAYPWTTPLLWTLQYLRQIPWAYLQQWSLWRIPIRCSRYWLRYPGPALRIGMVTIHDQHQPLFWTVSALSTVPAISRLLFLQYPNPKSKGTSYCSRNSYYSQQSWQVTVAVGGNSIHPSESKISPWFPQHPDRKSVV